jgi:predicted nucleic acid-binding protein
MIVVSDTTPINYLILIGHIEILRELFGQVFVPQAVMDELHNPGTPEIVREWADAAPTWLEVRQASQTSLAGISKLGAGESEAIALAGELNADAILMDDRKGAKESSRQGLLAIGTLAILVKASQRRLLDLTAALRELSQTNFRFPRAEVIEALLQESRVSEEHASGDFASPTSEDE